MAYFHGINVIEVSDVGGGNPSVDVLPPVVTSAFAGSVTEGSAHSVTLVANEAVTFTKRAGADSDAFVLADAVLTLPAAASAKPVYTCNLRATDAAGNLTDFTYAVTRQPAVIPPAIALSAAIAKSEGNSGVTTFEWTLTLTRNSYVGALAYSWLVEGITADAADFGGSFPSGTGSFGSGETSKTIMVLATGDTVIEPDETFRLVATLTGYNSVTANGTNLNDDAAPANTVVPAITGTAQEGQILTASAGSWNGAPSGFAYQWRRGGMDITGSVNATRTLTAADVGAILTVAVSATNASGTSTVVTPGTAAVVAAPAPVPANTVAPAVTGTATVGSLLTSTAGTWSNSPTGYAYQWRRDGVDIAGATATTYTLAAADGGRSITCRVVATNAGGSAGATSNAVAVAAQSVVRLAADRPFQMMELAAPPGQTLFEVAGVPDGVTPTISPNDGRFAIGERTAQGTHPVVRGTGLVSPSFVNLSVAASGKSVTVPVTIADRVAEQTKFRNTVPVDRPQWQTDYQVSEVDRMHGSVNLGAFTHTAIKDGDFHDPSIWNTGTVPDMYQPENKTFYNWRTRQYEQLSRGTAVVNTSTFVVTVTKSLSVRAIHASARGMLWIKPPEATSIRIVADTIMDHGRWICEHEGGEYATDGTPRVELIVRNLMLMGPRRWYGAPKATRMIAPGAIADGATSVTLSDTPTADLPRVGDLVVIPSTDDYSEGSPAAIYPAAPPAWYYGPRGSIPAKSQTRGNCVVSKHQYRRITAVSGRTISWADPLVGERKVLSGTINGVAVTHRPRIFNLSRSIEMGSFDPFTRLERSHYMGMIEPDAEMWYVGHRDMGQTVIDPTLTAPFGTTFYADAAYTIPLNDPANVIGAYANHEHVTGAQFCDRQVITYGCSIYNPSVPFHGVGSRSHSSRHAIEETVICDFTAIGWSSEEGNEISQIINNYVIGATGHGLPIAGLVYQDPHVVDFRMHGHGGAAFENQSRACVARGNESYGCADSWIFQQQGARLYGAGLINPDLVAPESNATHATDPLTYGQGTTFANTVPDYRGLGFMDAVIPMMEDNISVGCLRGLHIFERTATDRSTTTPVVFRRNHCFGVRQPVDYPTYVNNYIVRDALWTRQNNERGTACRVGSGALWNVAFCNIAVRNYNFAFNAFATAHGYGILFYNIDLGAGVTAFQGRASFKDTSFATPQDVPSYRMMDDWISVDTGEVNPTSWGTNGVYIRTFRNLQDADLNQNGKVGWPFPQGPQEYGGVDPRPAAQQGAPGFWFDTSTAADYTIEYTSTAISQLKVRGAIIDGLGVIALGANYNTTDAERKNAVNGKTKFRNVGRRTADRLIRDNGLWNDNGTLKTRLHFYTFDRKTDQIIRGYVDITVTNIPASVRAKYLLADPNATIQRIGDVEVLASKPILLPTVAPTIVAPIANVLSIANGEKLATVLKSDHPQARWTVSGADAAQFEVVTVSGVKTLRFAGDTTRTNVSYNVVLSCANPFTGVASTRALTVNANTFTLIDGFDYTGSVTAGPKARTGTFAEGGGWGGNGVLNADSATGSATFASGQAASRVIEHNTNSTSHYVEWTAVAVASTVYPLFVGWGGGNWTYIGFSNGYTRLQNNAANPPAVNTSFGWGIGDRLRVEHDAVIGEVRIYKNGVLALTRPTSTGPGTGFAFHNALTQWAGAIKDLRAGPL